MTRPNPTGVGLGQGGETSTTRLAQPCDGVVDMPVHPVAALWNDYLELVAGVAS